MTPETLGLIAFLGALGAVLRYIAMSQLWPAHSGLVGIAVVNIVGSALAGGLAAAPENAWSLPLLLGLCGSLTTFSTLAVQLNPGTSSVRGTRWVLLALLHSLGSVGAAWLAFSAVTLWW
jgi:CrcB protein